MASAWGISACAQPLQVITGIAPAWLDITMQVHHRSSSELMLGELFHRLVDIEQQ